MQRSSGVMEHMGVWELHGILLGWVGEGTESRAGKIKGRIVCHPKNLEF